MAKVFLGVGHGGTDPGACANSFRESDLNLSIALACKAYLESHGIEVGMSRTTDANDPLAEEIRECNAFGPELAADIHNNAGGGDGAEVFYYSGGGTSKELAGNILAEIVAMGQNSRGIKTKLASDGSDYFGFIRETYAPAVIVECAFVDNAQDVAIIDTATEQAAMGVAIAKGIMRTLGVEVGNAAPAPVPVPESADEPFGGMYRCTVDALNVRTGPGLGYGAVAQYGRGETVVLDNWYQIADGYVWGRYTAYSGNVRYVAVGRATGKPEPDDYLVRA